MTARGNLNHRPEAKRGGPSARRRGRGRTQRIGKVSGASMKREPAGSAACAPVGRAVEIRSLGIVPYAEALALQRELVARRQRGEIDDVLLLLEHPHVLTLGVRGDWGRQHILAPASELAARAVEVHEAGRGGDVTYHGPGQLVGYPILDLKPDRCDVHRYVRDIEEVLIRTAADFGIAAGRVSGMTGVWVGGEKLAAIGVRISRWVTSHGFALNVATDLDYFRLIVPCGLADRGVTSMSRLLGRPVSRSAVEERLVMRFCEVFGRVAAVEPQQLAVRG